MDGSDISIHFVATSSGTLVSLSILNSLTSFNFRHFYLKIAKSIKIGLIKLIELV